jgi:hypothetical protein
MVSSEFGHTRAKYSDRKRISIINVELTETPRKGRVFLLAEINETKILIPLHIFIFVVQSWESLVVS